MCSSLKATEEIPAAHLFIHRMYEEGTDKRNGVVIQNVRIVHSELLVVDDD